MKTIRLNYLMTTPIEGGYKITFEDFGEFNEYGFLITHGREIIVEHEDYEEFITVNDFKINKDWTIDIKC